MAFHNTNWTAVPLSIGTYTLSDLGNGLTGSTVHQVFCAADGEVTITAMGGGEFTWLGIAGQKVDVVASKIVVVGGSFVGFKASFQPNYRQQIGR